MSTAHLDPLSSNPGGVPVAWETAEQRLVAADLIPGVPTSSPSSRHRLPVGTSELHGETRCTFPSSDGVRALRPEE